MSAIESSESGESHKSKGEAKTDALDISNAPNGEDLIEARFGTLSEDLLVAEGQKAKVYRVQDLKTGKMVVVKLSRPRYETFVRSEYDFLTLFTSASASSRIVQVLDILMRPYPLEYLNEELYTRPAQYDNYGERIENSPLYGSHHLQVALVLEAMDDDLFEYLEDINTSIGHTSSPGRVIDAQNVMWQVCTALLECKKMGVIHRDVKLENFLIKDTDSKDANALIVKLADFDLSTLDTKEGRYALGSPLYRSPELLDPLVRKAGYEGDVWSAGCIFVRLLSLYLFLPSDFRTYPNISDSEERSTIFRKLGTSSTSTSQPIDCNWMNGCEDPLAKDLMRKMLTIDYKARITIEDVLLHPYFKASQIPLSKVETFPGSAMIAIMNTIED